METPNLVHLALPCPVCSQPAHMVANLADQRSRWCCVPCRILGVMPITITPEAVLPPELTPVASA
jgi:hypothetical protein